MQITGSLSGTAQVTAHTHEYPHIGTWHTLVLLDGDVTYGFTVHEAEHVRRLARELDRAADEMTAERERLQAEKEATGAIA